MSATTNSPAVSRHQKYSPQPPPMDFSTTRCEALAAGVSRRSDDVAGPTYINVDSDRQAGALNDYKPAVMMSQLMPLYATHHLHPSISAYQHHHQPLQLQQPSSYSKSDNTCEQTTGRGSDQGRCAWTMTFVTFLIIVVFHELFRLSWTDLIGRL